MDSEPFRMKPGRPVDRKRVRNLLAGEIMVPTVRTLGPDWPDAAKGIAATVVT